MSVLLETNWLWPVLTAPFVGSFLALLVVRLPAGEGVVLGRSACLDCGHALGIADLIPVASWLASRGRCRHCGARIPLLYPAVEGAALGLALWASLVVSGWLLWASCALGWSLLALAAIDWRAELLPDAITLPLAALGLAVAYALGPQVALDHAIGAALGFAAFAVVRALYARLRGREGMGLGDAKLLAAAGAWVSWHGLPGVVLMATMAALVAALARGAAAGGVRADSRVPFGPFLALGTWLTWLYGPLMVAP